MQYQKKYSTTFYILLTLIKDLTLIKRKIKRELQLLVRILQENQLFTIGYLVLTVRLELMIQPKKFLWFLKIKRKDLNMLTHLVSIKP